MIAKPATPPGYLTTFCFHFVLPNVLLFLGALIVGGVGAEYGLPYLIWHDDPSKQFWVGFAFALVALQTLYLGFMLWAKKAGRPDRLARYPEVIERMKPTLFARYCGWIVGQLALLVVGVAGLVLFVQFIDEQSQGTMAISEEDGLAIKPPRPNYSYAFPLGAIAAAIAVFSLGWCAKKVVLNWTSQSGRGAGRRVMTWLIDAAERDPAAPSRGSLLVALWAARNRGSRLSHVVIALFIQSLLVSLGVLFTQLWELSNLAVAIAVAGSLVISLLAVRARWLNDRTVFRVFLAVLATLCYLLVTWLGSRPWCGWAGSFFVFSFLAAIWPAGVRYAFPGPTARLLRATNERIIDPLLCRIYPFHGVAILFIVFGALMLFVLPMAYDPVRSPMVLGMFLVFMGLVVYGLVAYAVDDALPFLAPAIIILVLLSGLPKYKMQFPGLEYASRGPATPSPLLDLEAVVEADLARQEKFNAAVAKGDVPEADRLWAELESENRILPGKDRRPRPFSQTPSILLKPDDIAFATVPANIVDLKAPLPPLSARGPAVKKPLVLVVASGGGVRAAAWTFLVLSQIEARFAAEGIPFPYHVRMISGASGGMFGAAYYVRSIREPGQMQWGLSRQVDLNTRYDKLTSDWLTPLCERMVVNDVPGLLSPFPLHTDRGVALEEAWMKGLDGELGASFSDMAEKERAGWCPSLAFSPMIIEDGRRLLISNLDLRYPASNDGNLLEADERLPAALADQSRGYSHEAMELFRMFPGSNSKFSLATAVRMSASFPYFSPAVSLPTIPRRRVVDAGYYDNYGVSLAASYLFSKKQMLWLKDNVSKVVILQIRDGQSDDERRLEAIPDAGRRRKGIGSLVSRSLEELTSPLEGLNNGRVGTCSFRNDGLLELLSTYFSQLRNEPGSGLIAHKHRFFTVVNFEFPGHAALSWHLSAGEREEIRRSFDHPGRAPALNAKIDSLLEWWKADVWTAPTTEAGPIIRPASRKR